MAMKDFKETFRERLASLKANKALKLETGKINAPLKAFEEKTFAAMNFAIPASVLALYRQADGCHLTWRSKEGAVAGEFYLQPLSTTLSITWKDKLWFDWMEKSGSSPAQDAYFKMSRELKGLDVMDQTLNGTLIIALRTPEKGSSSDADFRLFYWDSKGLKFPLMLGVAEYVETALRYGGMLGWQRFFINLEAAPIEDALWKQQLYDSFYTLVPAMESFIADSEKLFAGQDISDLTDSLERIKSYGSSNNLLK